MKFGFRIPNLNKGITARTSLKRYVRQNMGFKAPRGWGGLQIPKGLYIIGFITEPARAAC